MKVTPAIKRDLKSYLLKRIKNKDEHRVVEIQTPFPMSLSEQKFLKNYLSGKVDLKNTINPELLGGFVLVDGSEKIDASIAGQLDEIVNSLIAE
ncbi:hypothetical protein A2690_01400 [Candidatus Roizmanbacteria bacterium RIFCSPHIGHO2_01_FULL_39_12b]|uniref:Uncharacterized protein n=1 Tax=Candidatus Roizmanbacteria bacterium RIFCSPHIGHO2_01_FULL_39_12b TaxID=1802030 RepID=A0A1F7GBA6_9BACT|nr:MAG: hypothetical protein A2690_01400 [Candidatus Roizmanbacteria bacterium RIFCSPHIGHO2_01_FULL_39_12b]OGK46096.1 MAG: hypothetical protein A3B46_01305 [Candidatus Roizmanbacteria bacterium RIFCSPLOWO2_01_FULL_39_19]